MAVGDKIQITIEYKMWGQTLLNVTQWNIDVDSAAGTNLARMKAIAEFLGDPANDAGIVKPVSRFITSDCKIVNLRVQTITAVRRAPWVQPVNLDGLRDSQPNQNIDTVVQKLVEFSSRGGKGAIHFPPGGFDDYEEGTLKGPMRTLVAANTLWMYTVVTIPANGMKISPVVRFTPPGGQKGWQDVIGRRVQETTRVMTRRTVGRGI
jgi:hypothetical protein